MDRKLSLNYYLKDECRGHALRKVKISSLVYLNFEKLQSNTFNETMKGFPRYR